ncbi:MAG: hypothetical protein ABI791_11180, partial [Acidobacteriota bacterium]
KTVTLATKPDMSAAPAANISGKWTMMADAGGQQIEVAMDLKQTGGSFDGSMSSHLGAGTIDKGTVAGKSVSGVMRVDMNGQAMEIQMVGTIDGETMSGSLVGAGLPPIVFTASKVK